MRAGLVTEGAKGRSDFDALSSLAAPKAEANSRRDSRDASSFRHAPLSPRAQAGGRGAVPGSEPRLSLLRSERVSECRSRRFHRERVGSKRQRKTSR